MAPDFAPQCLHCEANTFPSTVTMTWRSITLHVPRVKSGNYIVLNVYEIKLDIIPIIFIQYTLSPYYERLKTKAFISTLYAETQLKLTA